MRNNKTWLTILIIVICFFMAACASIPTEAPDLSVALGKRLSAIEDANLKLLHRFFDLKRAEVDRFIQNEWVPVFAEEIFKDHNVMQTWNTIVSENNKSDRLMFLITMGPKLQERINQKRTELIKPLDDVERKIEESLRTEYSQAVAINNSITSFLVSASKVEQNRNRYLQMIGVTDNEIGIAIDKVDEIVGDFLSKVKDAQGKVKDASDYVKKLKEIKESLGSNKKEG
ncbi:MAG: hypothetical protein AB2L22_09980 [Syntrophales bacterium]